ncbi:hypothetical protein [Prochlorococcus marinus]|uniref:hypothetical protein n=1 Tax=Prochlorococcus marinus TaxID=1219 RepID=UPI0022B475D2|nr:hypothetical protein [Prochlorococcus marinus]
MSEEEMNQELSADDLKDISGGVVDFGGSQFKPKANKGWWTVDGATFRGKFKSLRNRFRKGGGKANNLVGQEQQP